MITFVSVFCVFVKSLEAAQTELAAADWSVQSPHSLLVNPPSDDGVLTLLNKLTYIPGSYTRICSSRFADLRHSGTLSLIVSASDGGVCDLQIIDKTASGFVLYDVDSSRDSNIELKDIDENGGLELIADVDLTSYDGAGHCEATWPVVYAWTGSGYIDVSNQYKGYYEQYLKSLNRRMAASFSGVEEAQAPVASYTPESEATTSRYIYTLSPYSELPPPDASTVQGESPAPAATPGAAIGADPCMEAEAAKIERFLGISRDAGMSDAINWANTDDVATRRFAIDILSDIGTSDAIVYLRTLSNDSNREVAYFAKSALANMGQPIVHKVERADVDESLQK